MPSNSGKTDGFTLIEMLVVLAVLGMSLGLLTSYGSPYSSGMSLRGATGQLAGGMRDARGQAIFLNRPVAVSLNMASRAWQIDGGEPHALPDDVKISIVTLAGEVSNERLARIRFFPDGSSSGGRIILMGVGHGFQIGSDWLTGRVSVVATP